MRLDVDEVEGLRTAHVYDEVSASTPRGAEKILIVAHRDAFFEGASDNASGVATAIELAQYFSSVPQAQRRRTVQIIGSPGHHNLASTGSRWLLENRETVLRDVALLINAEHTSHALVDYFGNVLYPTNALGTFTWTVNGSRELSDIANRTFDEFGIPRRDQMGGPTGEIGRVRNFVPSVALMHAEVLLHSNAETEESIPASGLAATARAYAKIIERVNELDLSELEGPDAVDDRRD